MFSWANNNIFQPIITAFESMFSWVKSNIFDPIVSAFKTITSTFDDIISSITKAVDDVKSAFSMTNSVSSGQWYDPGEWFGGGGGWFSNGGMVGGSALMNGDSKANDTVPAMLSPGEIVIPRTAVQKGKSGIDSFLGRLGFYNGGIIGKQAFAMGGVVTDNPFLNKLSDILQVFLDKFSAIMNKAGQGASSTPSSLASVVSGLSSYSPSATLSTYNPPSGLGTGVVSIAQEKPVNEKMKQQYAQLKNDFDTFTDLQNGIWDRSHLGRVQGSKSASSSYATELLDAQTKYESLPAWSDEGQKAYYEFISASQKLPHTITQILQSEATQVYNEMEKLKKQYNFSNGGIVGNNGIDSKLYDTVPAMLSKGEMVIPKSAVKGGLPSMVSFIQDVLGMQKQQYAFGGMVDLSQAGKGTMSISNVSSSNTALNDEIKNLRNEIRAIGTALLRDTVSINRTMTQWNGEGLPFDRGY